MVAEMKASDRRKNLVLYGVPVHVDNATRKPTYMETSDIFKEIGFAGLQPNFVEILASKDFRFDDDLIPSKINCTIRVQFPYEMIAAKVLKNAWRLKASDAYKTVFIAPDRTYQERKDRAELVEQLKRNIYEQPSTKWAIRRGKVVASGGWDVYSDVSCRRIRR